MFKSLSFRQKLLITYTCSSLVLILITFISAGLYINTLQKRNVSDALDLAKDQAHSMATAIHEMMLSQNISDIRDPNIKSALENVTRLNIKLNENLSWAAIISATGDYVIVEDRRDSQNIRAFKPSREKNTFKLDESETNVSIEVLTENNHDVSIPISEDGKNFGHIYLRLNDNPHFKQIEDTSQRISRILTVGCILMLLFVLVIFLLLWKMFNKQLNLQQRNARLDRMAYVGTLASGLAHEIRNPLTSMSINLDVMQEELTLVSDPAAKQGIELSKNVKQEVMNLNSTLTSFLDFALPRREGLSLFSLTGLIKDLIELHKEQMKSEEITWELDFSTDLQAMIEADQKLLHQAIRNVLLNAIQILSGQVKRLIKISVAVDKNDNYVIILSDSGPGIDPENLSKIFEVFFSTRKGGSGFGLAIAKKIAEDHGGNLTAANNEDTRGARFVFTLPKLARIETLKDKHLKMSN